jgi:hypothetical protein
MFHLEQSIAAWRKQMLAAGIKSPVPLEELESHLRDEIEQQVKSGMNKQTAFDISVRQIGQPKVLKDEFKKSEGTFIIGVLVGMALIMPAAAQCRHEGVMTRDEVVLYTFGLAMCFAGIMFVLLSLKKRPA